MERDGAQKVRHRLVEYKAFKGCARIVMQYIRIMDQFDEIIEKICSLRQLFDDIRVDSKRIVLQNSFKRHIENFVHKMEEMYYKKIILNRSITRYSSNHEKEIQQTFNTLNAFMPLMVAYSTMTNTDSSTHNPFGEPNICQNYD